MTLMQRDKDVGGGIYVASQEVTISSTITNNTAGKQGGGYMLLLYRIG